MLKKNQRQRVVHNEIADTLVILRPLEDIAQEFILEECYRQLHQLNQVIRDQCNVYARSDVHQYPVPHHIENRYAQQDRYIADQHHVDEFDVRGFDPHVDNRFRDKGQQAGKQRDDQHYGEHQYETLIVRDEVFKDTKKASFRLISFSSWESLKSAVGSTASNFPRFSPRDTSLYETLRAYTLRALWPGLTPKRAFVRCINDYEMAVVPEDDRRERHLFDQFVDRTLNRQSTQTDVFRHRYSGRASTLPSAYTALVTQVLQRVVFAKMLGDDFQTCRPAVLRVHLVFDREEFEHKESRLVGDSVGALFLRLGFQVIEQLLDQLLSLGDDLDLALCFEVERQFPTEIGLHSIRE